MKTSRTKIQISIVLLLVAISGSLWFLEPWALGTISVENGPQNGLPRQEPVQKPLPKLGYASIPRTAAPEVVRPKNYDEIRRESYSISAELSQTLKQALGEVKKEIEATEIAHAEVYPCPEAVEEGGK